MSLSHDLTGVLRISPADRRLLAEAMVWLSLLRLLTLTLPYRRVTSLLGLTQSDPSQSPPWWAEPVAGRLDDPAGAIGWAVRTAAIRTPWPSTCLVQSLAGHMLLRRHGLQSTVLLGVAKDSAGTFIAHSWLQGGNQILTGRENQQLYSVIAAYRQTAGTRR